MLFLPKHHKTLVILGQWDSAGAALDTQKDIQTEDNNNYRQINNHCSALHRGIAWAC